MKYIFTLENNEKKNPGRIKPETVYVIINNTNDAVFESEKKYDRIKLSLETKIEPKYFGKKENKFRFDRNIVKKHANSKTQILNVQIRKFESAIEEVHANFKSQNLIPTKEQFKNSILSKLKGEQFLKTKSIDPTKKYLSDYISSKIEHYKSRLNKGDANEISESRIKIYESTRKHLVNFENFQKSKLEFSKISSKDILRFYDFINDYKTQKINVENDIFKFNRPLKFKDGAAQNTIAKYSKALTALINKAIDDDGIECALNTKNKSIKIKETNAAKSEFYMSEDFLFALYQIQPTEPELLFARNYLLLGSLLGFRYELFKDCEGKVYTEFVEENINFYYIDSFSTKTQTTTYVPLFRVAVEILDNFYEGKFPVIPANNVLNKNIKDLIKHYDLDKKLKITPTLYGLGKIDIISQLGKTLSTHDCRSTLISNLSSYGVDEYVIAAVTHPKRNNKLGAFNSYNRIDYIKKAKRFYWEVNESVKDSKIYYF